jgi:uncharacterized membrane protein YhaH (DUF805 family)
VDVLLDLFSSQGRANRSWYFWHIVLDDLAMITAAVGLFVLADVTGVPLLILPAIGVVLAGIWAGMCITFKRLHDLDRPSWHWLLLMIPLYNLYLGLVLLFQKGTSGPNRFGNDPLAGARLQG